MSFLTSTEVAGFGLSVSEVNAYGPLFEGLLKTKFHYAHAMRRLTTILVTAELYNWHTTYELYNDAKETRGPVVFGEWGAPILYNTIENKWVLFKLTGESTLIDPFDEQLYIHACVKTGEITSNFEVPDDVESILKRALETMKFCSQYTHLERTTEVVFLDPFETQLMHPHDYNSDELMTKIKQCADNVGDFEPVHYEYWKEGIRPENVRMDRETYFGAPNFYHFLYRVVTPRDLAKAIETLEIDLVAHKGHHALSMVPTSDYRIYGEAIIQALSKCESSVDHQDRFTDAYCQYEETYYGLNGRYKEQFPRTNWKIPEFNRPSRGTHVVLEGFIEYGTKPHGFDFGFEELEIPDDEFQGFMKKSKRIIDWVGETNLGLCLMMNITARAIAAPVIKWGTDNEYYRTCFVVPIRIKSKDLLAGFLIVAKTHGNYDSGAFYFTKVMFCNGPLISASNYTYFKLKEPFLGWKMMAAFSATYPIRTFVEIRNVLPLAFMLADVENFGEWKEIPLEAFLEREHMTPKMSNFLLAWTIFLRLWDDNNSQETAANGSRYEWLAYVREIVPHEDVVCLDADELLKKMLATYDGLSSVKQDFVEFIFNGKVDPKGEWFRTDAGWGAKACFDNCKTTLPVTDEELEFAGVTKSDFFPSYVVNESIF